MANLKPAEQPAEPEAFRYRRLPPPWQAVVTVFTALAVFLAVNQLFNLQFFVGDVILDNGYLYLLLGLLLSLVFLVFPAARSAPFDRVPWYDGLLFLATVAVCGYFAWNAMRILHEAWEYAAPQHAVYMSYLLWALLLEAVRRAGGWTIFVIILVVSFYPTYAGNLPGAISGLEQTLADTAARSEEHTSELQSLMRISYAVFCLKKKNTETNETRE